jgi:hypothetical protein
MDSKQSKLDTDIMSPSIISKSSFGSRLTDLSVLSVSFLLFVGLMDIKLTAHVLFDLITYVMVVFVCLRLARRLIFDNMLYTKRIFKILIGNVSGLVTGAMLILLADQFIPFISQSFIIVILASILAFFILGTLSPLIKSSNHDRIIH